MAVVVPMVTVIIEIVKFHLGGSGGRGRRQVVFKRQHQVGTLLFRIAKNQLTRTRMNAGENTQRLTTTTVKSGVASVTSQRQVLNGNGLGAFCRVQRASLLLEEVGIALVGDVE